MAVTIGTLSLFMVDLGPALTWVLMLPMPISTSTRAKPLRGLLSAPKQGRAVSTLEQLIFLEFLPNGREHSPSLAMLNRILKLAKSRRHRPMECDSMLRMQARVDVVAE